MTAMVPMRAEALIRPRAVLFDWDNTLVDSWALIHRVLNETFAAFGLPSWTPEQTRQRVRKSMRESFPGLFGTRWEEAGRFFCDRFQAQHLEVLKPLAGAQAMLAEFKSAGLYLGVVSNKHGDLLRAEVAHLGWMEYFGRVIGAFDAACDKPASDPVDLVLEGSGIARGPEVWFVGDADIDLECAVKAGCVPVLVREAPVGAGEFGDFSPTLHVKGCETLCKALSGL